MSTLSPDSSARSTKHNSISHGALQRLLAASPRRLLSAGAPAPAWLVSSAYFIPLSAMSADMRYLEVKDPWPLQSREGEFRPGGGSRGGGWLGGGMSTTLRHGNGALAHSCRGVQALVGDVTT